MPTRSVRFSADVIHVYTSTTESNDDSGLLLLSSAATEMKETAVAEVAVPTLSQETPVAVTTPVHTRKRKKDTSDLEDLLERISDR